MAQKRMGPARETCKGRRSPEGRRSLWPHFGETGILIHSLFTPLFHFKPSSPKSPLQPFFGCHAMQRECCVTSKKRLRGRLSSSLLPGPYLDDLCYHWTKYMLEPSHDCSNAGWCYSPEKSLSISW